MPSMKILQLPNRGGKTYQALKWLHDQGGGTFITQYDSSIAQAVIDHFEFKNITVLALPNSTPIAIDDVDARQAMITMTFPASLSWR